MNKQKEDAGKTGPMIGTSVRARSETLAEATKLGLDISQIFRDALEQAVNQAAGKCPTCKRKWTE